MTQVLLLCAGLKSQLSQLSQQLYQASAQNSDSHSTELQQKVLSLEGTVSQLTAQLTAQQPAQHSAQLKAREAELEQEYKQELSALELHNEEQLLELKTQHSTEVDRLKKQVAELETGKAATQQEQSRDTQKQVADLKRKHAALQNQLQIEKAQLEADLKQAHDANSTSADKHSALVKQLTQDKQQLKANLQDAWNASQSTSKAPAQHEPEFELLREQKQRLETDLEAAQQSHAVLEDKLVTADLALVGAEEDRSEVEQKLTQAEKQASKAAKTIRVRSPVLLCCPFPLQST